MWQLCPYREGKLDSYVWLRPFDNLLPRSSSVEPAPGNYGLDGWNAFKPIFMNVALT